VRKLWDKQVFRALRGAETLDGSSGNQGSSADRSRPQSLRQEAVLWKSPLEIGESKRKFWLI
jgi:hypothetical protein